MGRNNFEEITIPEMILSRDDSRAYQRIGELGRGGNGIVYEVSIAGNAEFEGFKNPVESGVLKLVLGSYNKKQEALNARALINEIKIYQSPARAMIKMLDYGEVRASHNIKLPYAVLEKLQAHPFEKFEFDKECNVDLATAINTYSNLLINLNDIHTRKKNPFILCDIKPDNIMLRMSNCDGEIGEEEYLRRIASGAYEPVFMDLGCALNADFLYKKKGEVNSIIGTPLYLPPECFPQSSEEKCKSSPGFYFSTTDAYALTLTFYQYLSGKKPYSHVKWIWQAKDSNEFLLNLFEVKREGISPFDSEELRNMYTGGVVKDLIGILDAGLKPIAKNRATISQLFDLCKKKFKLKKRRIRTVGKYFFDGVRGIDWQQTRFPVIKPRRNMYTNRKKRVTTKKSRRI